MRLLTLPLFCLLVLYSCTENKKSAATKYPDQFRGTIKGEPQQVELFRFLVDSSGQLMPDSLHTEVDEWKDGYLFKQTTTDSSKKNTEITSFYYFDNGQLKTITTDLNGKRTYRLEVQLDSNGRCTTAQSYDSTGKMDAFNTGLKQDSLGMVTAGNLYLADSVMVNSFKISYDGIHIMRGETIDTTGKLVSVTTSVRQADHELIEESTVTYTKDSSSTKLRRFRYEDFDGLKNWKIKTELNEAGKPAKVTKRKIIYVSKT